ncbi:MULTISPECIES: hypothetical protein [unclassified Methanosarcina]|nr:MULTISPECIES: hypothetical protein [unclassified Methanosarcina]
MEVVVSVNGGYESYLSRFEYNYRGYSLADRLNYKNWNMKGLS